MERVLKSSEFRSEAGKALAKALRAEGASEPASKGLAEGLYTASTIALGMVEMNLSERLEKQADELATLRAVNARWGQLVGLMTQRLQAAEDRLADMEIRHA